jgi:hypothetical protein
MLFNAAMFFNQNSSVIYDFGKHIFTFVFTRCVDGNIIRQFFSKSKELLIIRSGHFQIYIIIPGNKAFEPA